MPPRRKQPAAAAAGPPPAPDDAPRRSARSKAPLVEQENDSPQPKRSRTSASLNHELLLDNDGAGAHVVGTRVLARFERKARWYPGTVRAVHSDGSYSIDYEDGDAETRVPADHVKLDAKLPVSAVASGEVAPDPKAKAKAALSAIAARARAKAEPMVEAGVVSEEMVVEVVQLDDGLVGSRYSAVVLELKRGIAGKRASVGKQGAASSSARAVPTEALVEYDALFDDDDNEAVGEAEPQGEKRLQEWVPIDSLRPPPSTPDASWQRALVTGAEAAVLYDGGWWEVVVSSRLPGNVRLGEPTRFVVEAVGYGVKHTVEASKLRPRTD